MFAICFCKFKPSHNASCTANGRQQGGVPVPMSFQVRIISLKPMNGRLGAPVKIHSGLSNVSNKSRQLTKRGSVELHKECVFE